MRFFVFSIVVILFASCATSSKSSRVLTPVRTKPSANDVRNKNNVDTVEWTILSEKDYAPIKSGELLELNPLYRNISEISFLIPFESTGNPDELSRGEQKFSNYYGGVLMAIEELEELSKTFNINVIDTKRSSSKVSQLLNGRALSNSDVIIGPYEIENLKQVARWGKSNNIPVVSPWRSSSNIAEDNLYYYQLRPLIEQYFGGILRDALNKYNAEDIYIVNRESNEDRSKVRVFHKLQEEINSMPITEPINEFVINADSLHDSDVMIFDSLLLKKQRAALILPCYSSKDSRYVYSVIRKLNAEIFDQDIAIYGMPTLINVDRLDLEFFRSLELNTVDFKFVDLNNTKTKEFVSAYFERFGQLPNEDSFHGYDTMILLSNLSDSFNYGSDYSELSRGLPLLSMNASFERYSKSNSTMRSRVSKYIPGDFMVNSNLRLIDYYNNRFRAIPIE